MVQDGADTHSEARSGGNLLLRGTKREPYQGSSQKYENIRALKQEDSHEMSLKGKKESSPMLPYLSA